MKAKPVIRLIHRWLGLVSGILVLIVALTGATLAFEDEGRDALLHDLYHVPNPGAIRLPLHQLVDTFNVYYPKTKINSLRFKETADAAFVFFTKDRYVFMNPYTGGITGSVPMNREFFTVVRTLHTELCLGPTGKAIVHYNVLLFFFIVLSGLILWWPKRWRLVKKAVTIDLSTGNAKRINYDVHRALGFWALPILLVISFTGLFMAFDATKGLVAFVTGSPFPGKEDDLAVGKGKRNPAFLDSAYAYAHTHYPGATETFLTPATGDKPIRVAMRYPFQVMRRQNTFLFHPGTGALLKADLYANSSAYDKVARSNYNLHTGKFGPLGIAGKVLYCLAALAAASLPVTGGVIYWGKRKRKIKRIVSAT